MKNFAVVLLLSLSTMSVCVAIANNNKINNQNQKIDELMYSTKAYTDAYQKATESYNESIAKKEITMQIGMDDFRIPESQVQFVSALVEKMPIKAPSKKINKKGKSIPLPPRKKIK